MTDLNNPETIEIHGLRTITKLCHFGADNNMEGCTFTEIVERLFAELEKAKAQAVPEGYVVVPKDVAERTIGHISIAICHPNNTRDEENIMSEDQVVIERAIDASESGAEG